jgi:hypothetical protein
MMFLKKAANPGDWNEFEEQNLQRSKDVSRGKISA